MFESKLKAESFANTVENEIVPWLTLDEENEIVPRLTLDEKNAVRYVAGYVVRKVRDSLPKD